MNDDVQTSRFLSYVLRHRPDTIGLRLDAHGWASVDDLLVRAREHGRLLDRETLERTVATNAKQRFALSPDGKRIRANQGHSVAVDLALAPAVPPERLYHGTAAHAVASIRERGLIPGRRHHVHLSPDAETARAVGRRHGAPVVLRVRAGAMHASGGTFYRAENGVWLTDAVPPEHIEFPA